jgi:hypothetical protein
MTRVHPDGRKETSTTLTSVGAVSFAGNLDILVKSKEGNVIADSKRDRIGVKKQLAEQADSHRADPTLISSGKLRN